MKTHIFFLFFADSGARLLCERDYEYSGSTEGTCCHVRAQPAHDVFRVSRLLRVTMFSPPPAVRCGPTKAAVYLSCAVIADMAA